MALSSRHAIMRTFLLMGAGERPRTTVRHEVYTEQNGFTGLASGWPGGAALTLRTLSGYDLVTGNLSLLITGSGWLHPRTHQILCPFPLPLPCSSSLFLLTSPLSPLLLCFLPLLPSPSFFSPPSWEYWLDLIKVIHGVE